MATDPTGAQYPFSSDYQTPQIVVEAVKRYDDAYHHHRFFVNDFERRERAYRGILKATSQAARWRHTMHPPYAFNMIETIVSNEIEMGLDLKVQPAPLAGLSQQEAQQLLLQSNSVRDLIRHERTYDRFDAKQRPLYLCDSIGGRGIGKTYWNWTQASVKRQGVHMVDVHGPSGTVLGQVPTISEIESSEVLYDNSTTEVVDPRDFILHESAKALQPRQPGGAQYLFHRSWLSMEQLRMMQADGFVSNVEHLSNTRDFSDEYTAREKEIWRVNRTKDLVEVVEYWYFKDNAVWRMIYGNRTVELRPPEKNPFWHGEYPFFIISSQPQLNTTIGMSDIELIESLQEMLWELTNQRLDNTELIGNAIMLIRGDVDDPDAFQYYPGAQWPVDDTAQVAPLVPPYQVANVSLEAEALIKGDMQAVTSASPMAGGNAQNAGQTTATATGASIIMTAAQQRLASKKWQAQQGLVDEAQMRLKLCQQFIQDDRLLHTIGPSGKASFRSISPLDIQGEFLFSLSAVGESQNRQERRAESQAIVQLMMQAYPMSYVSGTPIDLHEVLLWAMRSGWDMEDEAEAFFMPQTQPDPAMVAQLMGNAPHTQVRLQGTLAPGSEAAAEQGQGALSSPPGPGGQQAPPPTMNAGTTAQTAVDASKPSATGGLSMSGAQFLQRAKALYGGIGK